VQLRHQHGFPNPPNKILGIGNEVDGPWQIGYKRRRNMPAYVLNMQGDEMD